MLALYEPHVPPDKLLYHLTGGDDRGDRAPIINTSGILIKKKKKKEMSETQIPKYIN